MKRLDQMQDEELIRLARGGNRSAFGELVRRHRAKAVFWAKQMTNDPYLADDIVQDALLRSYLYLESLKNTDRFLPWLKSIVTNKAVDHMRKNRWQHPDEMDGVETDPMENPEQRFLDEEIVQTVLKLMETLGERNRNVFAAHFLRQMSPNEIATDYNMHIHNVYNIISRAKSNLRKALYSQEIARYIADRKAACKTMKRALAPPQIRSVYSSMGHAFFEMLQYTHWRSLSLEMVMGLSGQAFRIQMTEDAGLSSALIYDWKKVFEQTGSLFGAHVISIGQPNRSFTPDLLLRAIKVVHDSIDRGVPVVVWNLYDGEYGLLYGYDDEAQTLLYSSTARSKIQVPFARFAKNKESPELFIGALGEERIRPSSSRDMVIAALDHIVRHYNGEEKQIAGYTQGLAAYDRWIHAIEDELIEPISHAYHVTYLTEAREQALAFLQQLRTNDLFINQKQELERLLNEAIRAYEEVVKLYDRIYPHFPFGMKGFSVHNWYGIAKILRDIQSAELYGMQKLKAIQTKFSIH